MKNKGIKIIASLFFMIIILVAGCGKKNEENKTNTDTPPETVTISGSTSVGPLIEKEAEQFKKENTGINVEINQIGSSAGIKDAINGTVEIGMSSRDLKEEEIAEGLVEVEVAFDGMAVITSKNNKIDSLKLSDVKDIYTGKITNWKDVGGEDSQIVVVSREDGSGTRDAFQEIVGYTSEELYKESIIGDGSGNIKTTVAGNNHAIGFISFEYIDDSVNAVKIDDIAPIAENVKNGEYKLSRPFLLVYKEENLKENGNKLIDFILSKEGQNIVEESGLIRIN
ncbi:MAG: phosphate ABC transporter substrate-binding protein [Terrisporobacter othiniensis]|uniref:phosphate ABC transporter substrate-binding protein n=1 Tax=Terrisporobacter othiniensis TaxID=1577792 RepID=UPI002906FD55|nr:phosphate ABC transporter substrate-binding protein [Terrisporobacter othiniensis]MDU6984065.1 phosphate ABC transporter substrate-binding protein [Terrisporobacter othiniensis]